jgi:hypothetical protein
MTGMGNLSLMVSLLRVEVRTHVPRAFFLKDHDHRRRVGARTRMDNTCGEQFLNNFLNFIFLGKGMMIGMNIGRKVVWGQGEWNDHEHHGKEEVPGEWKKQLDVWRGWIGGPVTHRGCLSGLNGMEL